MRIWGFFAAQELDPRDVKIIAPLKVAEKCPLVQNFDNSKFIFTTSDVIETNVWVEICPEIISLKSLFWTQLGCYEKKIPKPPFLKSQKRARALGSLETGKSEDNLKAKKVEPVSSRGTLSPIKIFTREKKIYSFSDFSRGRIFSLATRFFGLTTVFFFVLPPMVKNQHED